MERWLETCERGLERCEGTLATLQLWFRANGNQGARRWAAILLLAGYLIAGWMCLRLAIF